MLNAYWKIGERIVNEEQGGNIRADYGTSTLKELSKQLTFELGKGFTKTNLYSFTSFYEMFPKIFHTACGKSTTLLPWSHYRTLIQELNVDVRSWYEKEALQQNWSVRTLQRNLSSQYYFHLLASQRKDLVENEIHSILNVENS